MIPEPIRRVRAANGEISGFLAQVADPFLAKGEAAAPLDEVQRQLEALAVTLETAGQSLGTPPSLDNLDAESRDEVNLYAAHLERLKNFLVALQTYAEGRREQLITGSRKISDALAWSDTLKLTTRE
jgi:hypothetical protein